MKSVRPLRLAVLLSGQGTNLQALIDAIAAQKLSATIAVVLSDNMHAFGLERAKKSGIKCEIIKKSDFDSRLAFDLALFEHLKPYSIDLVVLAGFMHVLSPEFVDKFPNHILNIHPSLLPKYPGLHTHQAVITAGDTWHGTTIHIVTEALDAGPILAQAKLAVSAKDTALTLKERVQALEHRLYPETIELIAQGRLKLSKNPTLDGRRIHYESKEAL